MRALPTYIYSREIKLKIKVLSQDGEVLQRGKIRVDRDTLSFDRLQSHLTKTFKLKTPFMVMYHVPNTSGEGTLAMVDDWDVDTALQQFRHSVRLTIQTYEPEELQHTLSCDYSTTIPSTGDGEMISALPTSSPHRLSAFVEKLMDKLEKIIFSDKDTTSSCVEPQLKRGKSPMTLREFQYYLDVDGRLVNYQAFRENIYLSGISPSLRKIAWRHLLCVFPEGMTGNERIEHLKSKSLEYTKLRDTWKAEYKQCNGVLTEEMRFITNMVRKDVVRTDKNHSYYKGKEDNKHTLSLFDLLCTYAFNHPDVSYCQGMCDLASPLLVVQDNEGHAYLLFCALMERMRFNFSYDSRAITTKFEHLTRLLAYFDPEFYSYLQKNDVDNLLFSYRWMLLEMKREFPFHDSLYFCEIMWSTLPYLPTKREIPLHQTVTNLASLTGSALLSPYSKMCLDSDTDSIAASSSSTKSVYPECEPISRDQSIVDTDKFVDHDLTQEIEDEDIYEGFPLCAEDSDCPIHRPRCMSVFYFDLEGNEIPVEELNEAWMSEEVEEYEKESDETSDSFLSELKKHGLTQGDMLVHEDGDEFDQERCTCSTDSGFSSRPNSPIKSDQLHFHATDAPFEICNNLFLPPKEFGFGNPFVLFASLVMILQQRDQIMEKKMDLNDILMLFNNIKCRFDVHAVLKETKQLYEAYIRNELGKTDDDFVHIELPGDHK